MAFFVFYNSFLPFLLFNHIYFVILCRKINKFIKKKKQIDNISAEEQQKEVFREKADHYLVCFIDGCPLREHTKDFLDAGLGLG
jgi:hypothetical protein